MMRYRVCVYSNRNVSNTPLFQRVITLQDSDEVEFSKITDSLFILFSDVNPSVTWAITKL